VVAASDSMKALPHSVSDWVPQGLHALGTDGYGRSEARGPLRDFFEVDAKHIAFSALRQLQKEGSVDADEIASAIEALGIDPEKPSPAIH